MTGIRKGYPQFDGLKRSSHSALFVYNEGFGGEVTLAGYSQSKLLKWASQVALDVKQLIELEKWSCDRICWPHWYDKTNKTAIPVDVHTACSVDYFQEELTATIAAVEEGLSYFVSYIGDEIHNRGLTLWSEYPDVSFSFNREKGTIDMITSENLLPLLNREIPQQQSGEGLLLLAKGVDLTGQDFSGADFAGLYLEGIDSAQANLPNADLSGADLSAAIVDKAQLFSANLGGVNLANVQGMDGMEYDKQTICKK